MLAEAPLTQRLRDDGYAVIPQLFSEAEVCKVRGLVDAFFNSGRGVVFNLGRTQPNAAIECGEINELILDPRVKEVFRRAYDNDALIFTGHCDFHSGIISSFHRDTGGETHDYFDVPCFVEDCRVYKMALYLQDHDDGHGLTVYPGSHKRDGTPTEPEVSISTKMGDAIIFDVRIIHRGQLPNAFEKWLHKANRTLTRLARRHGRGSGAGEMEIGFHVREAVRRLGGHKRKASVFFTIGEEGPFARQFSRNNMARQLNQYDGAEQRSLPAAVVARYESVGVAVVF